jgi:hypothetical protein
MAARSERPPPIASAMATAARATPASTAER